MKNFKINISNEAKENLRNLLENNPDYSCIRIDYIPACGGGHIDLCLDEFKNDYIIENIGNLFFMYSDLIFNYISSIDIIFKDSTFMIKSIPQEKSKGSCGGCCNCKDKSKNCNGNCHKTCCKE